MIVECEHGNRASSKIAIRREWGLAARVILNTIFLILPGATASLAQVASSPGTPFSRYQLDLQTAADTTLADANSQSSTVHASDSVPIIPVASFVRTRDAVRHFAQRYWNGRYDDLLLAIQRVQALRDPIEPILEAEGLPPDLIGIVLVESAGNPFALSPRGAYGLWQLMPTTARRYGLVVSPQLDERTDTGKATRAAAQYLKDLHARFGSWPLALAAYNSGEATVQTAVGDAKGIGAVWGSFAQEKLPVETQNYVPAVVAARRLFTAETSRAVPRENEKMAPFSSIAPTPSAAWQPVQQSSLLDTATSSRFVRFREGSRQPKSPEF